MLSIVFWGFISDAFCYRGSTFPLKCFLNDGAPRAKIAVMPVLFRKYVFVYLGHAISRRDAVWFFWMKSIFGWGMELFKGRRSLRKVTVNLYRRTPSQYRIYVSCRHDSLLNHVWYEYDTLYSRIRVSSLFQIHTYTAQSTEPNEPTACESKTFHDYSSTRLYDHYNIQEGSTWLTTIWCQQ